MNPLTDYAKRPTKAEYECAKCRRSYEFTSKPPHMPLVIFCECGNKITADDAVLRSLPEPV